jgi:hypothetical protein
MSKPIIIIDTNSLSHLSEVEINREKSHRWLWKYFDIRTCRTIKNEFSKNINQATASSKVINKRLDKIIIADKYKEQIESRWLTKYYYKKSLSKEDEGQTHLATSIVELSYYKKFTQIILVTDDQKAINTFLNDVKEDILFGEIWNTLDLIIYLYFIKRDFSKEAAKSLIRDIGSQSSYPFKKYCKKNDTEADGRINLLSDYNNKIDRIESLKNILPNE